MRHVRCGLNIQNKHLRCGNPKRATETLDRRWVQVKQTNKENKVFEGVATARGLLGWADQTHHQMDPKTRISESANQ